MAKIELDQILKFEELLHSFALIERVAHIPGRDTRENDVEHSYFLPMLAWYVIDAFKLPYDVNLVIRYALVHDLVEVYAGDTYIFDEEAKKTKQAREESARLRIAKEFPEFESLNKTIEAYEAQSDTESKFVKTLDKIEPVISNFLQKGRTWKEMDITFEQFTENKRERVTQIEEIRELLEEIIAEIEVQKSDYF